MVNKKGNPKIQEYGKETQFKKGESGNPKGSAMPLVKRLKKILNDDLKEGAFCETDIKEALIMLASTNDIAKVVEIGETSLEGGKSSFNLVLKSMANFILGCASKGDLERLIATLFGENLGVASVAVTFSENDKELLEKYGVNIQTVQDAD